jgi:hypothetical protein
VVRQGHFIAVVVSFLMGCVVLLAVGCAGVRSEAPEETQGHTELTKEQTHSDRCEGTRRIKRRGGIYATNDGPGCPKGGLLSGTAKRDVLNGKDGDDEIHGLGGSDDIFGGAGNDVIYGGPGVDFLHGEDGDDEIHGGAGDGMGGEDGDDVLYGGDGDQFKSGGKGEDVLYGGKGNDALEGDDRSGPEPGPPTRDELYCGPGKDQYSADSLDYVDSSCEEKVKGFGGGIA